MDSQPLRARAVLAALISAFLATPALAQRDDPGLQMHCASDYFQFCAGADPDSPEVERCFTRNRTRLSAACKAAIGAYDRGESTTSAGRSAPR